MKRIAMKEAEKPGYERENAKTTVRSKARGWWQRYGFVKTGEG
jgi:hypothetical protein